MDHRNCLPNTGPVVRLAVPHPVTKGAYLLFEIGKLGPSPEYVYSYLAEHGLMVELEHMKPERKQSKWPL